MLDEALVGVRHSRHLPDGYCFKFSDSRPQIRDAFFAGVAGLSVWIHATVIDKATWPDRYLRTTTGQDRTIEAIMATVLGCRDEFISGQTLLVDSSRDEQRSVNRIRDRLRRGLSDAGRGSFARVKAYPDHGNEGAIIQVADMVAGALQDAGEAKGPYLVRLRERLSLCQPV
jgi:hypothetical protein